MEIVLQWLDELDDLVFAGVALWQRLRLASLGTALAAAISLHLLPPLGFAGVATIVALYAIGFSLGAWMILAMISARADRSWQAVAGRA